MVGQRVDVLTRNGAVPASSAKQSRSASRAPTASRSSCDDLVLDIGAKDGDELRSLVRPGDTVIGTARRSSLQGNRIVSRAFDNRMGCYVALESRAGGRRGRRRARRRDRRGRGRHGRGRRLRRRRARPRSRMRAGRRGGDRRHPRDRRARRRSRRRGRGPLGGGPAIFARPVDPPADVFELLYETAEQEEHPARDRDLAARHDDRPTPTRSTSAARACRPASSPFRSATCTRRSRCVDSTTSRRPCSCRRVRAQARARHDFTWLSWPRVSRTVIVSAVRTPFGKLGGGLAAPAGDRARRDRDPRRRSSAPALEPERGRLRDHGPGAAGRRRPGARAAGRGRRRDPDRGPRRHDQQGLRVVDPRGRDRRLDDPRRRRRGRRDGRDGVDVERAVRAPEGALRLPARRRPARST